MRREGFAERGACWLVSSTNFEWKRLCLGVNLHASQFYHTKAVTVYLLIFINNWDTFLCLFNFRENQNRRENFCSPNIKNKIVLSRLVCYLCLCLCMGEARGIIIIKV